MNRDTGAGPEDFSDNTIRRAGKGDRLPLCLPALVVITLSAALLSSCPASAQNSKTGPPGREDRAPAQSDEGDRSGTDDKAGRPTPPSSLDKLGDLEGCWTSEAGFALPWQGVNYYYYYCFDRSGRARSYAARLDGTGSVGNECHFGSSVEMDRLGFILTEDPVTCPGWNSGVYNCKLDSPGVASCVLRLRGNSAPIHLYYQGAKVPEMKRRR
jgi:hypothetical protein